MKQTRIVLAPLLCVLMLQVPVSAHASASKDAIQHFHDTCDYPLYSKKQGDLSLGNCEQGVLALKVHKMEKLNTALFGAATGVAIAMVALENSVVGTAAAKGVCIGLAAGAAIKTMTDQGTVKKAGNEVIGAYANAVNGAVRTAAMGFGATALKGMVFDGKKLGEILNVGKDTTSANAKKSCIFTAIGLGVMTSAAISGATFSRKALETTTTAAKTQLDAKSVSYNLNPNGVAKAPDNNPKAPNNNPAADTDCEKKSGNAVLACMAKQNPEVAALVNNPQFMDTMNKALGGKNLGDFVKGYDGESQQDLANYVGSGLGMSGSGLSSAMDITKKAAKDLGMQEAYKPGTYANAGNSAGGAKGGVDPMEKMLADMMAKMGDPGEDGLGQARDPASEISFGNQMELLTPEQVAARRDISLFDRAHYRMQKNAKNLEQLNWTARDPQ